MTPPDLSNTPASTEVTDMIDLYMTRRITREAILLIGGGRAALLQLAHPLVAAGVERYSRFCDDPLDRLARTIDMMMTLFFGDVASVQMAIDKFNAIHCGIHGTLPAQQAAYAAGSYYDAQDPELKLWVHATLIDTSLVIFERFISPLTVAECERYIQEACTIAQWLGIPASMFPKSLREFSEYFNSMLASGKLAVTSTTTILARNVLYPQVPTVPRMSTFLVRLATAGLLPPALRAAYGLEWSTGRSFILGSLTRTYRLLRHVTPDTIAVMPQAGGGRLLRRVILGNQAGWRAKSNRNPPDFR